MRDNHKRDNWERVGHLIYNAFPDEGYQMKVELMTPNLVKKLIRDEIGTKIKDVYLKLNMLYQEIDRLREHIKTTTNINQDTSN